MPSPDPASYVDYETSMPAAISSAQSKKWFKSWPFWALTSLTVMGSVGVVSAISLFRIPNLPNCRAIFWPTASATTRIQCAEAFAGQGTVEGYLSAIDLVNQLPEDHPLRTDINQRIEAWAENVLSIAEGNFQAGDLEGAIAAARSIPTQTAAAALVNERVQSWKETWEEAEAIYEAAETELKNRNFKEAFSKAIQLLTVGNTYWETTRYNELTELITSARNDLNQLGQARRLAKERLLDSMLEAIEIAQSIRKESPMYGEAQDLIREFGRDMLSMTEDALDRRNSIAARNILEKIPKQAGIAEEIADMRIIVDASELSWQGGITGLEGAIVRLQSISQGRPLYNKAQDLMASWQAEAEGLAQLDWARQVAQPGTAADLKAAIAEARQISSNNPVWDDAQDQIDRWQSQIETAQDRPFLVQADGYAQAGDLQGAINTAQMIRPGRALYDEAQTKVKQWTERLQRQEDQPILSEADRLASTGQWQEAISVASRIRVNRVLYNSAQDKIKRWQTRLDGERNLQNAYQIAQQGSLSALEQAIQVARQVPDESPQHTEAERVVNQWSWDLMRIAEAEAQTNLNRAISVAQKVPVRTEAYAPAQLRIREWQDQIQDTMPTDVAPLPGDPNWVDTANPLNLPTPDNNSTTNDSTRL